MDRSTAQALNELATLGRLSDESVEAVADALGVKPEDDETKAGSPEAKSELRKAARS